VPAKRSHPFQMRLLPREYAAWRRASRRAGFDAVADWARRILNTAAAPPPPSVLPVVGGDQVELPLPGRRGKA